MRKIHLVMAGMGVVVTSTLGFLIVKSRRARVARYALTVEATEGGDVDGTYPPDFYTFHEPRDVTLTATPKSGFLFDGWFLDGVYQHSQQNFTFRVTENHLLLANFKEEGAPQLIPAYIKPTQSCDSEDWWHTWVEYREDPELWGRVLHLEHDCFMDGFVKFKICNEAGNGVSNQQIAVYTDPMPDLTDYGYLLLNGVEHPKSDPLLLTSNSEGVVAAKARYEWREPGDHKQSLGYAGSVHWVCIPGVYEGDTYPIWDGDWVAQPCYYQKYEKKRRNPIIGPTFNPVHAYWVDNPDLAVWGDCHARSMVKMEGSKHY